MGEQPAAAVGASEARPWRRFIAKTLDYTLFSLCVCVPIGGALVFAAPELLLSMPNKTWVSIVIGSIVILISLPIEAALLSRFGATPGKFLMATRVRDAAGARLSFRSAMTRSFKSFLFGYGAGIPVIGQVAMLDGYFNLKKEGIVSWDKSGGVAMIHDQMNALRWTVGVGLFLSIKLAAIALLRMPP